MRENQKPTPRSTRPRPAGRRPLVDLVLVLAVVGLVVAAYVIAEQPWSLDLGRPMPTVQTSLMAAPVGTG